jgi:hypothetical protein
MASPGRVFRGITVTGDLEFRSEKLSSKILHPGRDFAPVEAPVELRWDPLTGYASLNLRMVCRFNLQTGPYRSDVTYFERLHWQAMVDTSPEELAKKARAKFAAGRQAR